MSMEYEHTPVLLAECMESLRIKDGGLYVDGTLGGGGHTRAILEAKPNCRVIGIDRDYYALKRANDALNEYGDRFTAIHGNFMDMPDILAKSGINAAHGILLDLGVSSFQLDNPERGFSYMHDGKLDMRMDDHAEISAHMVINEYPERELREIISRYGEEKWAGRIAKFICERRVKEPIETTFELVDIIKAAIPASARRTGPHPAKRTFQAIRIEVNGELKGLPRAIESIAEILSPGGRLLVITFHSLEDRIVKQAFKRLQEPCECPKELPCVCGKKPLGMAAPKGAIEPGSLEVEINPRSRSAKLRVFERLSTF